MSLQSVMIRCLLRHLNMWNKPITDIRDMMEKVKTKGLPKGVMAKDIILNTVDVKEIIPTDFFNNKVILYYHGGGFCLGIYTANLEFVATIAKDCGMRIFMPDYRLAPEHPFPSALVDAMAVYKGLLAKGYKAEDIIVMGDSSGCGLALSALLDLSSDQVPMPSKIAFITPVFDFAGKGDSFKTRVNKDPFRIDDPLKIAKTYVGDNNPTSTTISPLYADLKDLPPILIHAGDYDVFLSDSTRFYEKAKNVGTLVNMKVWPKMWHIFHMQASILPESKKALDEIYEFIRQ